MDTREKEKILQRIDSLPKGSISVKTINGKEYEYWQFRENGKQISRRVKGVELEILREQIDERKRLEAVLKNEAGNMQRLAVDRSEKETFRCLIRTGSALRNFVEPVVNLKKRDSFNNLWDFVNGTDTDRVFILYGLRRTGKTTLIRQTILEMSEEMRGHTAFIQATAGNTLADINHDLSILEHNSYKYIFIDEVTLLEDFIEGAALFSDVFAASGMKIVLSGTDSLGFVFSEDEQLYDRCFLQHTTFIPYREFERVLGINGLDEYIRYGGTMSLGGKDYNHRLMTFATEASTNEYIDSAIAKNIQHSLKNYQYGSHFRHLQELYDADELTNAINRIVEDMNHRFTREVIVNAFKSHDLGISRNNLRHDREMPTSALDKVDIEKVTDNLMWLMDIRDKENQTIDIRREHVQEIQEYLEILDLVRYIQIVNNINVNKTELRTVITQPGLRHAQAQALISSLLRDESFRKLGIKERNRISARIMAEIDGRMMEDIILLETQMAEPDKQVFVLKFAVGEFDMVVHDPEKISCRIFEIKHSEEISPVQYRHLQDTEKCAETEKQYGEIEGKYVIYRGCNTEIDGIQFLNAEDYLKKIG